MSVYALNLLREMRDLGHDMTLVAQYRGDPLGKRVYGGGPPLPVDGVRVIGLESVGEQDGGDFERDIDTIVRTVLDEHEQAPFDLVHAQYGYPPGLAALKVSRAASIPNVVSIQGGDGHWVGSRSATLRAAMEAVLDHAGAVLIGAQSFADEVTERLGTALERFTIIPGAVDIRRFAPRPGVELGAFADPDKPVLLYHGRVDARKGSVDLVDAFAQLAPDTPARLLISGIGPDYDATATRIAEHGLEDRATLTGYAAYDDVPALYHQGDLFVSPTYAEGFSNTILEAMASGLPIVSTKTVGVVDCLRDMDNALLVEPGDVDGLTRVLRHLLGDAALRRRLAERALDEVRSTYAWPVIARRIDAVYRRLAGTAPDDAWSLPDGPVDRGYYHEHPHLL